MSERPRYVVVKADGRYYRVKYGGTAHLRYLRAGTILNSDFRRLSNGRVVKSQKFLDDIREPTEYDKKRLQEARDRQANRKLQKEFLSSYGDDLVIPRNQPKRYRAGKDFGKIVSRLAKIRERRQELSSTTVAYRLFHDLDAEDILYGTKYDYDDVVYGILILAHRKIANIAKTHNGYIKLGVVFRTDDGRTISFAVYRPIGKSVKDMFNEFIAWLDTVGYQGAEPVSWYLNIIKPKQEGGCSGVNTHSFTFDEFHPRCRIWLTSPKSKDNNCLLNCFNISLNKRGNKSTSIQIRRECGFEKATPIHWEDAHKVAKWHKCNMELFLHPLAHEHDIKDRFVYAEDAPTVRIHLMNGHYVVENNRTSYFICTDCGAGLHKDPKTGKRRGVKCQYEGQTTCVKCDPSTKSYFRIIKKKMKILAKKTRKTQKRVSLANIVFYDLETFQNKDMDKSECYAVGFMRGTDTHPTIYHGKNALDSFIEYVKECEDTIFVAFNGARFDHYFLVNKLLKEKVPIEVNSRGEKKVVVSNGRVLSFEFGEGNKVWDLCLFLLSSLDKAGKEFGCEVMKGDFDHTKVKSWEDAKSLQGEYTEYLKKDVLLLKDLFIKYSDSVFEYEGFEVTNFMTMPQMGFASWTASMSEKKYDISIDYTLQHFQASRESRYGGRCYPLRHRWNTQTRDMDWQKLYDSNDFYVAVDIVSMYPAVMKGCKILKTAYPVGEHRDSKNPEADFREGKFGIYYIHFTPDPTKSVPVLPKRKNGLKWDFAEGEGWYTNIDILNAIEFGNYRIKFTDRAMVWDETTDDLFTEFIGKYFELKKTATTSNNAVLRLYAKIMMNALYGKLQQKPFDTATLWSNDGDEIQNFMSGKTLDDMFCFEEGNLWMITAKKSETDLASSVKKPLHLGAFVLSYSRRLYLTYLRMIDPTLTRDDLFIYTDTDSFFVKGEDYKKLQRLGCIGEEIGMLGNDIKGDGLITDFIAYAPKTYYCLAVTKENKQVEKCGIKGIPQKDGNVKFDHFQAGEPVPVEFTSFQKIHCGRANKQEPFSINVHQTKRTALKSLWEGMDYADNIWTPKYRHASLTT